MLTGYQGVQQVFEGHLRRGVISGVVVNQWMRWSAPWYCLQGLGLATSVRGTAVCSLTAGTTKPHQKGLDSNVKLIRVAAVAQMPHLAVAYMWQTRTFRTLLLSVPSLRSAVPI